MTGIHSFASLWLWFGFITFIVIMLGIDLFGLGGRRAHHVSTREALSWTVVWISLALIFNLLLWWYLNQTATSSIANHRALEFFTGYVLEKSLSFDNIFVFILIFNYFAIPANLQHRVLLYGVFGAIILRAVMILMGIWLVNQFDWIFYIFALILLVSGVKMLFFAEKQPDLAQNPLLRFCNKYLRVTHELHGEKFFVMRKGLAYATPLFLALILIELSDIIFALDSIPAIFGITRDPFIVFTSNIFAILGLRAMYFLLANVAARFHTLEYGVALILIFIGIKMALHAWYVIPVSISLMVIASILIIALLVGWFWERRSG